MKIRYINQWVLIRDGNGKLLNAEFVENAEVETNNQQEGFDELSEEQKKEMTDLAEYIEIITDDPDVPFI